MITIVVPSRTEVFLKRTVEDILEKATGDIEVFPVLDGYELPPEEMVQDPRVHYIVWPVGRGKRPAMNEAIRQGHGEHVMSVDAHCMFAPGFDEVLAADCEEDWVMVPRRHRLDAENWCLQQQVDARPPIDYEYLQWPKKHDPLAFHGFKWDARTMGRWSIPIDDILTFQGSCWIMHRTHFERHGFMDLRYETWGQEAEELSFTTWTTGGRVVVNKKTWYAHLHKGPKHGRMYFLDKKMQHRSYRYSYDRWMNDPKFHELIERFWPIPTWPANWKEQLCGHTAVSSR